MCQHPGLLAAVRLRQPAITAPVLVQLVRRTIKTDSGTGGKRSAGHVRDEINPADPEGVGRAEAYIGPKVVKPPPGPKTAEEFANPPDHWLSYGFDVIDKYNDRAYTHAFFFLLVTCVLFGYSAIFYYYPDVKLDSWAQREAYLELARRSRLPGPIIDRNYVPPELINLPTDEELGDMEIII